MDDGGDNYEPFIMDNFRREKEREERNKRWANKGYVPQPLQLKPASDFYGKPIPPRRWVVPGWVPERNVTMLSGDGGLGKSLLAMQLAIACATGTPWLGLNTQRANVLYIACEDDDDEIQRRIADICKANELVNELDLENLHYESRVGEDNALITAGRYDEPGDPTDLYFTIHNAASNNGVGVIIFDSLHDLFAGNENNRVQARRFIGLLRKMCIDCECSGILLAHPSASGLMTGTGASGSTAWNNAVRARIYLTPRNTEETDDSDENERILSKKKANYSGLGDPIKLLWENGAFRLKNSGVVANIERKKKEQAAQTVFLKCLDAVLASKRTVSWNAHSRTYAPRVFSTMKQSKGVNVKALQRAMEALFNEEKIQVGSVTNEHRNRRESIVRTPVLNLE